jgi:excisionase family DNA binding protein
MEGVLDRIVKRPELVRELGRQERTAAFAQLVFVAGPILSAFAEMGEDSDGPERKDAGGDDLLTVKEAAARLRVSPRTLYARVKSGRMPFALRYGRSIRISGRKLDRWIENRVGR